VTVNFSQPDVDDNPLTLLQFGVYVDDGGTTAAFPNPIPNPDVIGLVGEKSFGFTLTDANGTPFNGVLHILGIKVNNDYTYSVTVKYNEPQSFDVYAMFEVFETESDPGSAVVPLPAAAWGGMMLLGGIGAARLRRRKA